MSFKKLVFQCILILFTIGLSSCEKETNFVLTKKTIKAQINSSTKLDKIKANKIIFKVNKEITSELAFKFIKQFLSDNNLSAQTIYSKHYIYNEFQEKFVEGIIDQKTLIGLNTNEFELLDNHLITENSEKNIVNVFKVARPLIIGGINTVISVEKLY